ASRVHLSSPTALHCLLVGEPARTHARGDNTYAARREREAVCAARIAPVRSCRGGAAAQVDRLQARRPAAAHGACDRAAALWRYHRTGVAYRRRAPGGLAHDHASPGCARARATAIAATVRRGRTRACTGGGALGRRGAAVGAEAH